MRGVALAVGKELEHAVIYFGENLRLFHYLEVGPLAHLWAKVHFDRGSRDSNGEMRKNLNNN